MGIHIMCVHCGYPAEKGYTCQDCLKAFFEKDGTPKSMTYERKDAILAKIRKKKSKKWGKPPNSLPFVDLRPL